MLSFRSNNYTSAPGQRKTSSLQKLPSSLYSLPVNTENKLIPSSPQTSIPCRHAFKVINAPVDKVIPSFTATL
jgi:hypothetical protein